MSYLIVLLKFRRHFSLPHPPKLGPAAEPGQAIKAGRYVVDVVPDANRPAA